MTMYMTIGLPGSGKSTWAKSTGLPVLSSDDLRAKYNLKPDDKTVFTEMNKEAMELTEKGIDFVYDATNLRRRDRVRFLSRFNNTHKAACIFPVPLEVCKARNNARNRIVPEKVIDRMMYGFDAPFYLEGFDDIYVMPDSLIKKPDVMRACPDEVRYRRLCDAVLADSVIEGAGPFGTLKVNMYLTSLDRVLHTMLPVGSVDEILDFVYDGKCDFRINEHIRSIIEKPFIISDFIASQLYGDELTSLLFTADNHGHIVFPVKAGMDVEPYVGYIGEQTSRYYKENIQDHLLLVAGGLWEEGWRDELLLTALLHDASKKYETGTNGRGELCFYFHTKTSALFAAEIFRQIGYSREKAAPLVDMIYNHLAPFTWQKEARTIADNEEDVADMVAEYREQFRIMHGSFVTDNLITMNKYDIGVPSTELLKTQFKERMQHGRDAISYLSEYIQNLQLDTGIQ